MLPYPRPRLESVSVPCPATALGSGSSVVGFSIVLLLPTLRAVPMMRLNGLASRILFLAALQAVSEPGTPADILLCMSGYYVNPAEGMTSRLKCQSAILLVQIKTIVKLSGGCCIRSLRQQGSINEKSFACQGPQIPVWRSPIVAPSSSF